MVYLLPALSPRPLLTEGVTFCLLREPLMMHRDLGLAVPPNQGPPQPLGMAHPPLEMTTL